LNLYHHCVKYRAYLLFTFMTITNDGIYNGALRNKFTQFIATKFMCMFCI